MRDPHVRFCERHGGVISRAYSTNNRHLPGAEAWLVGEVSPGSCRGVPGMGTGLEVKVLCGASW